MNIGKDLGNGKNVELNLESLIATRLLIQANSGGGKSWLMRRVLEQSHGKVQQIVIDLEGEFSTLRERYDYLLVGPEGEIPANIKTAALLARKLLELNVSTIIDLSELKHHERILFVKRFIDSLIDAPKRLWHPCIIMIDEAHQFCPQSSKSESASSIIDLMTRGRKRGFCGALATQRISKLNKDACAEANNRLIGRTGLDIDRKRASEELGFTSKDNERSLRYLESGEFFAFGPSISKDIIKIKVGDVETNHPEAGKGALIKSSPTPENIKKLLKDVIDLPQEAETELKNLKDYKLKVMDLNRELRVLKSSKPKPEIDQESLHKAVDQGIAIGRKDAQREISKLQKELSKYLVKLQKIRLLADVDIDITFEEPKRPHVPSTKPLKPLPIMKKGNLDFLQEVEIDVKLGLCAKKLYSLLFQYSERSFTKAQIGVFTGYSYKSGGFSNALSQLRSLDLIEGTGSSIRVKQLDSSIAQEFDFSKEAIISKLNKCEREIYNVLLDEPLEVFDKENLACNTPTNYSYTSGGFSNALSRLKSLGLIERSSEGIKLNPELLEI